MRYIVILFLVGCVTKDRRSPDFKYEGEERDNYDCPHAPDERQLQERCKAVRGVVR